jgi:radical SAM-linked protein
MVFALPLPVGVQSTCEFLDVKIDKQIDNAEIKSLLNRVLTDELTILDVYEPEAKFAEIGSAEYLIEIRTPSGSETLADEIARFLTKGGVMMTKHTKSGEKEIDISTMICSLESRFDAECGVVLIDVRCVAGTESLNPEYLMSALKQYRVLPMDSLLEEGYSIMRKRVLSTDGREFR